MLMLGLTDVASRKTDLPRRYTRLNLPKRVKDNLNGQKNKQDLLCHTLCTSGLRAKNEKLTSGFLFLFVRVGTAAADFVGGC